MDESSADAGKWTLPLYDPRPRSHNTPDLCIVCEELFTRIRQPGLSNGDSNTTFSVGWIDRLAVTKYCSLCQFFVQLLLRNNNVNLDSFSESLRVLVWMPLSSSRTSSKGLRLDWDLVVQFVVNQQVDLDEKSRSLAQSDLSPAYFNLLFDARKDSAGLGPGDTLRHLGRSVPTDISQEFIRDGFRTCTAYHGTLCDAPKLMLLTNASEESQPDLSFLRVIDVQNRCLVPLPKGANYVVLSYTWSSEPFVALVKDTADFLRKENGIRIEEIPPTIADSMTVAHALGERYLWADRLCIIQDDADDKRIQIHQMDTIYRHACLTIVAASSISADRDVGLPGVRPGSRMIHQVRASVKGMTLIETQSWLDSAIGRSRWDSRAWTFQESLMSKRHLVFTPTRVGFFCRQDTFTEDYIREVSAVTTKSKLSREYELPASSDDVNAGGISQSLLSYEVMVRMYTQRSMSVDSDILNAATGLLQMISRETGEHFLCGMPMRNLLNHFMSWLPRDSSVRRGPADSGSLFPSWSWAGWVGSAVYVVSAACLDGRETIMFDEEPLIDRYGVVIPDEQGRLMEYTPEEIQRSKPPNMETCGISFRAASATVRVSTTFWGYFQDCESRALGSVSRCNRIFIDGHFAGMLLRHTNHDRDTYQSLEEVLQESDPSRSLPGELIALSTTYIPWRVYFPISPYGGDDVNFYYTDKEGEEREHLPFDTDTWDDEDPELVNVMLIEWHGQVAERVGIGQVHAEAWKVAEPVQKQILLG